MIYKDLNINELLELVTDKTLVCFGAGQRLFDFCEIYDDSNFFEKIDYIVDNDPEKKQFSYFDAEKPVYLLETCLELVVKEPLILITSTDFIDILSQLNDVLRLKDCVVAIFSSMLSNIESYKLPENRSKNEILKIPKMIHYCWFGGTPIPMQLLTYMQSWKNYCPDYEIVRWDESNYDVKQNKYMYEAYQHKKWAFVSDVARLDIINRYGGVYLDTDVELIRNIDDLLCDEAFCGFDSGVTIATGLGFGAKAGFSLIEKQLHEYDNISFIREDGTLNSTTCVRYSTKVLMEEGLKRQNILQEIDGMKIYPSDVLSPKNFITGQLSITPNTYAIHHATTIWKSDEWKKKRKVRWGFYV